MSNEDFYMETESEGMSVEEVDAEPDWTDATCLQGAFNLRRGLQTVDIESAPETVALDFDINEIEAGIRNSMDNGFWDYLDTITPVHYKWGKKMTLEQVMNWSPDIEEPVTRIPKNLISTAMKTFKDILMYSGDEKRSMPQEDLLADFLNSVCLQTAKFRDEVFIQLIKQLRANNKYENIQHVWKMLACLASCCSPSKEFLNPLLNYLSHVVENHQDSLYRTWGKYVLAKVWNGYKLRVRRTFQVTDEECKLIMNQRKTKVNVHLPNGTYLQCWCEGWDTYEDLKVQLMQRLGLDDKYKEIFGFLEVIERRSLYEERWIDEFYSCTEIMGFWNTYKKSKSDIKDFKLYFTLKAFPKIGSDPTMVDWQWMVMINDFKRGKVEATNSDIINSVALALQADLGDCPDKSGHLGRIIMNYIPVTRKSEGEVYWAENVMGKYQKLSGKSRSDCINDFFEIARDWNNFETTQFTGRWVRCSDEDNHDEQIPEGTDVIFLAKHASFQILSAETKQICVDLDLSEMSNWGCSKDQFVYSTGESHSRVKEYFKCPSALQVCWLLNVYAHQYVGGEPDWSSILLQKHIHLDKKKRHISTFSKVSDV